MDLAHKELLVARLMAGCLRVKVRNEDSISSTLVIRKPPLEQLYVAQELYASYKQQLEEAGGLSEEEMLEYMLKEGLWTHEEQTTLDEVTKHIEQFKIELYQAAFKANQRAKLRKYLAKAKEEVDRLNVKRQSYAYATNSGAAAMMKARYLLGMSLYYVNGEPVFTEDSYWKADSFLFDQVVEQFYKTRIFEKDMRIIARTDPWRSIWNSRKAEGQLFGIPSVAYNDEQRGLVIWTGIYDSVYEHPECPPDSVVEDDDLLDGWMILQRKKRKEEADKKQGDTMVENEKIKGMGEIFVPAETIEDARAIDAMNDEHSRMVKRQRLALVRKQGEVLEAAFPDSQQEIMQELNQKFMAAAQGKG